MDKLLNVLLANASGGNKSDFSELIIKIVSGLIFDFE